MQTAGFPVRGGHGLGVASFGAQILDIFFKGEAAEVAQKRVRGAHRAECGRWSQCVTFIFVLHLGAFPPPVGFRCKAFISLIAGGWPASRRDEGVRMSISGRD